MYTQVYHRLMQAKTRFVLSYGGTASGKSYSAAQKEINIATERKVKTLVIRKVGNTLRDSVIPSFRNRIEEMELADKFAENKSDRTLTHKENGSQIIFRGLDDPDKLKSFEGLERILVEEAAELEFEDFLELNRRARGRENIQITLCFNPMHEEHWLKKHFFDRGVMDDCDYIKSTYHDNPFLTDKDREQIELLKHYNQNQYRIYALGEWGVRENNAPWLFAFDKEKHVKPNLQLMPGFPVYLSFDFNRNPVTCLVIQMSPHKGAHNSFIHFVKEYALEEQLHELCMQLRTAYSGCTLFVTGDASGSHGDVGFENKHDSYYQIIRSMLNLSQRQLDINTRNLTHNDSRILINTLMHQYPNISISQEGCPLLISDCTLATVDDTKEAPGVLKKDRGIYKMDIFDCFRYFFQTYFKDYAGKVSLGKAA